MLALGLCPHGRDDPFAAFEIDLAFGGSQRLANANAQE